VVLGATTSVQDTGLLDEMVSAFETETGYHVTPVVGGSGDILERARRGELDVIMTHSPGDEKAFVDDGDGLEPRKVMENYFVVVGPPDDPAGVAGSSSLEEAFRAIATAEAPFISRGDNSGTHRRELATWEALGTDPQGQDWYQESAVSQGQNVLVASDKAAYTLVDSSTFTTVRDLVDLMALYTDEGRPNVYTVTLVNPEMHHKVNAAAARAWADFLTGPSGQSVIAGFGRDDYGEALFVPMANAVRGASSP
jgi:tungstate transport system substrate-binding protein